MTSLPGGLIKKSNFNVQISSEKIKEKSSLSLNVDELSSAPLLYVNECRV